MPELPEVETVRRSLLPAVCGRSIAYVEIRTQGVWLGSDVDLEGWLIRDVTRRGKYLLFHLSRSAQSALMIVHLRMTGRLLLQSCDVQPQKHTHIRIKLSRADDRTDCPEWVSFVDPRRFGRIWFLTGENPEMPEGMTRLGPEPISVDFNADLLLERTAKRQASLKAVLLDQTVVAGLGNIYADESLFAAGLFPARPGCSLSGPEAGRLRIAIVDVLERAIECNGTTLRDYADGWNRKGRFQDCLMVYGRAGEPCRVCGTTIRRMKLAGRSTCWCPFCQPDIQGDVK